MLMYSLVVVCPCIISLHGQELTGSGATLSISQHGQKLTGSGVTLFSTDHCCVGQSRV